MTDAPAYRVEEFDLNTSFKEVRNLCSRWSEARKYHHLPPFEDVAIGNLGLIVDDLTILRSMPDGDFELIRMGSMFRRQTSISQDQIPLRELTPNFRLAITEAVRAALAEGRPILTTTHALLERKLSTCEFLALPLRSRWGEDLILGFLRQRPATYDLVDAIYGATSDGLLALASVGAPSGVPEFQIVSLNAGAARLFGQSEGDLCWTLLSNVFPPKGVTDLLLALADTVKAKAARNFDYTFVPAPGEAIHVRVSAAPMGELIGVAFTNVTEVKRREESVRLLFEHNPMPLLVYDPADLRLLEANDAFLRRYGYRGDQLRSMTLGDLYPAEFREQGQLNEQQRKTSSDKGYEQIHVTSKGQVREVLVYSRDLPFEGRSCVLASIVDVTEQRHAEAQIVYLAHHDAITGLANRVLFKSALASSLALRARDGSKLVVHCIDLDYFKQVNDTFGHPTGDTLLAGVAARLKAALRETDVVARLGGDEFAIVQTGVQSIEEASNLAGRIIALLSAPYEIDSQQISIGASIGIAIAPSDGTDADLLLKNADIALYRAKTDGRGTYAFFEAAMHQRLQKRRSLEVDLRKALVRGEFHLKYQPLVEIPTGRIIGCEALIRWVQPERGNVSPQEFIPLAEETGLIVQIGDWVLRQACAEASAWPSDINIAVNLSPVQFKSRSLVTSVASALAASGLSPTRLELEITETVLLANSEANLATLMQLRGMGVKISMDDFGTGYSSLSYLRAFPFDKIKIDQSFITDLAHSEDCQAIVRAVVGLGANLGIKTLAEGVETEEQLAQLNLEGCTQVQGYLFSRPATSEDVRKLLRPNQKADDLAA